MSSATNIKLYPWFKFFQNLLFWQATWFLFFQSELSAAEAVLIYVFYDVATTVFEVPSGYLSDRVGRRITLILSALAGLVATLLQAFGSEFWIFALAQMALGIHMAFASGTDSSLLFESLCEEGREDEVEEQELRAWRFNFVALAISAVTGGAIALTDLRMPYIATAVAFAAVVLIALRFHEPVRRRTASEEWARLGALWTALREPVLLWLFAVSSLMYIFSHLPFIFGQPFILQALEGIGLAGSAPLVSGAVTAAMMAISVLTSWLAPSLRQRLGLSGILLLAFGMQIALVAGLALTASTVAIALLFLRMVPDSFSRPFILARIQPELPGEVRATYLSIMSLAARLLFAGTLYIASGSASDVGAMTHDQISAILTGYSVAGILAFVTLVLAARGRNL